MNSDNGNWPDVNLIRRAGWQFCAKYAIFAGKHCSILTFKMLIRLKVHQVKSSKGLHIAFLIFNTCMHIFRQLAWFSSMSQDMTKSSLEPDLLSFIVYRSGKKPSDVVPNTLRHFTKSDLNIWTTLDYRHASRVWFRSKLIWITLGCRHDNWVLFRWLGSLAWRYSSVKTISDPYKRPFNLAYYTLVKTNNLIYSFIHS